MSKRTSNIRSLTTKYGTVVARVEATLITIYNGDDMRPVATSPLAEGQDIPKTIRHLAHVLSIQKKLAARNIKLLSA